MKRKRRYKNKTSGTSRDEDMSEVKNSADVINSR